MKELASKELNGCKSTSGPRGIGGISDMATSLVNFLIRGQDTVDLDRFRQNNKTYANLKNWP